MTGPRLPDDPYADLVPPSGRRAAPPTPAADDPYADLLPATPPARTPPGGDAARARGMAAEAVFGPFATAFARGVAGLVENVGRGVETTVRPSTAPGYASLRPIRDLAARAAGAVGEAAGSVREALGTPTAPQRLEDLRLTEPGALGRVGGYTRETVGTLLGQVAPSIALGVATGGASAATQALVAGAPMVAAGIGEAGQALDEAAQRSGRPLDRDTRDRLAMGAGVVSGLLDTALPARLGRAARGAATRLLGTQATREAVADAVERGVLQRVGAVAREGGVSAALEGGTEGVQTAITSLGAPALAGLDTPDNWQSLLLNAAAQGAVGGGALAGGQQAAIETLDAAQAREVGPRTPPPPAAPTPTSPAPPASPTPAQAARRQRLQQQLTGPDAAGFTPDERDAIEAELATLPEGDEPAAPPPSPASAPAPRAPTPPSTQAAPTPADAAPPAPPTPARASTDGRPQRTVFSDGRRVQTRYTLVEADALVPSHDPFTFLPTPAYPTGVQGRDYQRDRGAQDAVARRTLEFDPDRALDPSIQPDKGPPTVTPDGVVIAGNERAMLLRRAAVQQPQRMTAYRQQLVERAEEFGLDPAQVATMQNPVLVRRIDDTGLDLADTGTLATLNQLSDAPETKAKRGVDQAAGDARRLTEDGAALEHFASTIGDEQTLAEYLDAAPGKEFVRQLIARQVIPPAQVGRFVKGDPARPKLSEEGKIFVRRTMLAAAIEDTGVLDDTPASVVQRVERAAPAIIASQAIPGFGLTSSVRGALRLIAQADANNVDVEAMLAQADLLDPTAEPVPAAVAQMARFLSRAKPTQVTAAFRRYVAEARLAGREDGGMFATDPVDPAALQDATFGQVAERRVAPSREAARRLLDLTAVTPRMLQADLFALPMDDAPAPARERLTFDATTATATQRAAWATLQDPAERRRADAGRPSPAFLDAFALLRGEASALPEEALLRREADTFTTDDARQGELLLGESADDAVGMPRRDSRDPAQASFSLRPDPAPTTPPGAPPAEGGAPLALPPVPLPPKGEMDRAADATRAAALRDRAIQAYRQLVVQAGEVAFRGGAAVTSRVRPTPRVGQAVGMAGVQVLGFSLDFLHALASNTAVSLIGQPIASPADLAVLAQAMRDPQLETGRVIVVDAAGVVVGHEAVNVGAVGVTFVMAGPTAELHGLLEANPAGRSATERADFARQSLGRRFPGAAGFYIVHNHPSGDPIPSAPDLTSSAGIARAFGDAYLGHVIINSGKYTFVPPSTPATLSMVEADALVQPLPGAPAVDPLLTPDPAFAGRGAATAGRPMRSMAAVVEVAKAAYEPGSIMLIGRSGGLNPTLRAVSVPPGLQGRDLATVPLAGIVDDFRQATGSSSVAIVVGSSFAVDEVRRLAPRVEGLRYLVQVNAAGRPVVTELLPDPEFPIAQPSAALQLGERRGGETQVDGGRTLRARLDTLMQGTWAARTLDALQRRTAAASAALVTFDDDVEARYQANKGVAPDLATRVRAAWAWLKAQREAIPALGRPSRDATTAAVNDLLLMLRRVPALAQRLAADFLVDATQGLARNEVDLLGRQFILDDLLKDLDAGKYVLDGTPVPLFGRDAEGAALAPSAARARIEAALADVQAAITDRPAVAQALVRVREQRRALVQALVEADLLPASVLADERYYHRQVLEYARAIEAGELVPGRKGARTTTSGFQRRRIGGGDFNTRFVEAEFEWVAQAYEKLTVVDIQRRVRAIADTAPALRRQAANENRRRFYERVAPLVAQWAAGDTDGLPPLLAQALGDVPEPDAQAELDLGDVFASDVDPLAVFRQRIGFGTRRVLAAITSGSFPTASLVPFADLIAAAEAWAAARTGQPFAHPKWWAFLSALAANDALPGADAARTIFKARQDRDAVIDEVLGDAKVTWRELLPDDATLWQPTRGMQVFRALSLPEEVVEAVLDGSRDLDRDDLREVLAMGGPKEQWAVPTHIAAALDDPSSGLGTLGKFSVERGWMRALGTWKFWQLYRPDRLLKYNLNNTAGDVDVTMTHPGVLRLAPTALRDLRIEAAGVATMPAALRDELRTWQRHGAIDTGFVGGEIQAVWTLPELDRLADPNPLFVMRLIGGYWRFAEGITRIRENTLRLAAARHFRDAIARTGRIPTFAASNPKLIRGLWERTPPAERAVVVAARLARDLIGDYQSVSAGGSWLRNRLMPFFSWQELNLKRYFWLIKNITREAPGGIGVVAGAARVGSAAATRAGLGAASAAVGLGAKATALTVAVHAFYAASQLWNRLMFPDEEEKLKREGRGLHVIYGVEADGTVRVVRLESAWAGVLKLFGLEDWPSDVADLREQRKTLATQAQETLQAPVKFVVQQWEPVSKGVFEWAAGVSFFPDPFKPRPIKEPGREWLRGQGLEWTNDLYRTVMGQPIPPSRPGPLSAPPGQVLGRTIDLLAGYRIDAGESAYWHVRQLAQAFVEAREGKGRGAARLGERDLALYYFRAASRWGDDRKAQEWLTRYYQLGGTPQLMRRALDNQDPLDTMPTKYRGRFLRSLTPEDRRAYRDARDWWRERTIAARRAARGVSASAARRAARED